MSEGLDGPTPSARRRSAIFDDKKVPGDFDILQSGRRRLRVDDEFERNHIRKIGKVAKAITERVSKLREEAAALGTLYPRPSSRRSSIKI